MNARKLTLLITFALVAMTFTPGFTVQAASPTVSSISPTSGSENGGTEVTVTGTNFEQGATVEVDGTLATGITVSGATSLKFKTPPHAVGTVGIVVTNPGGESTTFGSSFTYTTSPAPDVTAVSPGSGPSNGGTTVTITGTGFHADPFPEVTFGAVRGTVTAATSTSLTVIAPPQAAGTVGVTVENPDGSSDTLATSYGYVAAPAPDITGLNPNTGSENGGTAVTITGTGFAPGAAVDFGVAGPASKVTFNSATQITAVAPPGTGAVTLTVTNPDSQTDTSPTFTYTVPNAPDVISISPKRGTVLGGTTVTITGTGFHADSVVEFTDAGPTTLAAHSVEFVSASTLRAVTPGGLVTGAWDVTVTNPDTQTDTLAGAFDAFASVTVDSLSRTTVPTVGVTGAPAMTITGTNFDTDGVRVFIGGNEAGVTPVSGTSITVEEIPPHAAGAVDVLVINTGDAAAAGDLSLLTPLASAGGNAARLNNALTYVQSPDPTLAATDPLKDASCAGAADKEGPSNGGEVVFICGTGFSAVDLDVDGDGIGDYLPTVKFGSVTVPDEDILSVSATAISVKVPARPSTTSATNVLVQVTNPDGKSTASVTCGTADPAADGCYRYTVASAPTVTDLDVDTGDSNGGLEVVITGTGFAFSATAADEPAKPTVQFGTVTVPADDVTVTAATTITVKVPARPSTSSATNVLVKVTNPDGKANTGSCGTGAITDPDDCFRYTVAGTPGISNLDVITGSAHGGTSVTITGANFFVDPEPGAPYSEIKPAVTFGGIAVPPASVTVVSATELTVVTPGGASGTVGVTVTNPDGKSATSGSAFQYTSESAPTLTAIAASDGSSTGPTIGGTVLELTGTGFADGTPRKPTVSVGGTLVPDDDVAVIDGTTIEIVLPAGTAGAKTVVVTNPDTKSGSLGNVFRYLPAPASVSSLSASTGTGNGGNTVTLTGSGLDWTNPSVHVGGEIGEVASQSASSFGVIFPENDGAGLVSIGIADLDRQSTTILDRYTYIDARPPTFTSLTPITGSANGGTGVTVTGQNFANGATVVIGPCDTAAGTHEATGISASADGKTLTFVTPHCTLGPKTVTITNPNGNTVVLPPHGGAYGATFSYSTTVGPTITGFTPTAGSTAGGTSVTITGSNFQSGATVTFGGTAATGVTVVNSNTITATTPARSAGAVSVVVTNSDGQSGTASTQFTYTAAAPPDITAINPDEGTSLGGTEVTITGTNFQSGATVTIGGTAATGVTFVDSTEITATTPGHAAGVVDVVLTNPDGQADTLTGGFEYIAAPAPVLTSISPTSGTANGGTTVTLTGTDFGSGATVSFGGTLSGTVTFVSATELTAVTPGHAAGVVDVVVTNSDDQADTLADAFTYEEAPAPEVTSFAPTSGDVGGGTTVTILGSNFASGATVTFGGTAGTSVSVASNGQSLTVVTPARSSTGAVNVVVRNPDSQEDTAPGQFTYVGVAIPSDSTIAAANTDVQATVKVTSTSNGNKVSWDTSKVPSDAAGVQIWRIDSPAVWVADLARGTAGFTSGEFVDTAGSETSKYLVTVYWTVGGVDYGYSKDAITDLPGYTGLSEQQVEDRATAVGSDGLLSQWWFWVLIGVGALILILLIVLGVLMSRKGDKEESEWEEDDDLGWADDEGLDRSGDEFAGEDEPWEEGTAAAAHAEEVHTLECPNCQTQFTAGGAKPIVTTCPGCGKRGILR